MTFRNDMNIYGANNEWQASADLSDVPSDKRADAIWRLAQLGQGVESYRDCSDRLAIPDVREAFYDASILTRVIHTAGDYMEDMSDMFRPRRYTF